MPLNVVMSDIEWSSLENKSHSLKVEQEDRKDLGSCWLPQLYKSTWSISGLNEPIGSEFCFFAPEKITGVIQIMSMTGEGLSDRGTTHAQP